MRQFFAILAAVIAAMGTFVWRTVREGGRLVARLFREPGTPPAMSQTASAAPDAKPEDYDAFKRVAGILAMDRVPSPEDLKALPAKGVDWLRAQDRQALHTLMCADTDMIRAHIKGRAMIRGVVPYDAEAVRDVTAARAAAPVARPNRPRTRRDALEEMGMKP